MTERPSLRRTDDLRGRAVDAMTRAMAGILDIVEKRQDARDRAGRRARCPKAACRRSRRCRGAWCGS